MQGPCHQSERVEPVLPGPDVLADLVHMRLPDAEARALLLSLTPEHLDPDALAETLTTLLAVLRACLAPPMAQLACELADLAVLDCCGTGGSGLPHFNTSTAVAFVLAAAGVPVVKFGNRGITSASGSFDLLARLGVPAELPPRAIRPLLEAGLPVFLYAPQCYPALAPFNALRRSLGQRTLFNVTGPLLNPANPAFRLLGVSDAAMQDVLARVLPNAPGLRRAWVVRGEDGLDEVTPHGATRILDVGAAAPDSDFSERVFHAPGPGPNFLSRGALTPEANHALFLDLLTGKNPDPWVARLVCLNAGAALAVAGRVSGVEDGAVLAESLICGGKVLNTVEQCRRAYEAYV